MANAKLAPLWLITATPIGLNRWNLIVRNAGYMSSVFVPLGVTLKGSRGNEIRDFRFVAQGSPAVDPGEAVSYEVRAIIYDGGQGISSAMTGWSSRSATPPSMISPSMIRSFSSPSSRADIR